MATTATIYGWKPTSGSVGTYLVGSGTYAWSRANLTSVSSNTDRMRFGQYYDGSYHLNEAFVRFDTSSIPDGATVTNVKISFYPFSETFNDLDIPMELRVYVKDWYATGNALTGTDHVDGANLNTLPKVAHWHIPHAHPESEHWTVNTYQEFESTTEELANLINAINKSGFTEFLCSYDWLENGHVRTGYNYGDVYGSNNTTQTKRPRLEITYSESEDATQAVEGNDSYTVVVGDIEVTATDANITILVDLLSESVCSFYDITTATTTSISISVDDFHGVPHFPGAHTPYLGERDIDGFLVYIHQGTSNTSPYVFGTEPDKEQIHMLPADVRDHKLYGLPVDKFYHFKVVPYRVVDDDIDPVDGVITSLDLGCQYPNTGYAVDIDNVPHYEGPFKPGVWLEGDVPLDWVGLYGNDEKLGFVENGVWKTYMDSQGRFYLKGDDSSDSLSWADSKLTISAGDGEGLILNGGAIRTYNKESFGDDIPGFWIGTDIDGEYKFYFGGLTKNTEEDPDFESEPNFISWDGNRLRVQGNLAGSSFETLNKSTMITAREGIKITTTGGGPGTEESLDFYYWDAATLVGSFYSMDVGLMGQEVGAPTRRPLRVHATEELDITSYGHIYAWAKGQMYFGSAGLADGSYGDINFDAARNIVMGFGNQAGDYWGVYKGDALVLWVDSDGHLHFHGDVYADNYYQNP
jgi:hypothetical protein